MQGLIEISHLCWVHNVILNVIFVVNTLKISIVDAYIVIENSAWDVNGIINSSWAFIIALCPILRGKFEASTMESRHGIHVAVVKNTKALGNSISICSLDYWINNRITDQDCYQIEIALLICWQLHLLSSPELYCAGHSWNIFPSIALSKYDKLTFVIFREFLK